MNTTSYAVPKRRVNDWITVEGAWWRFAIALVFCLLLPSQVRSGDATVFIWIGSFVLGSVLIAPIRGRFGYQWIGASLSNLYFVLIKRRVNKRQTIRTYPEPPRLSHELELKHVIVKSPRRSSALSLIPGKAGDTYLLRLTDITTSPHDQRYKDPEDKAQWDEIVPSVIDFLGQSAVTQFAFLDWRIPFDPHESQDYFAKKLDSDFHPLLTDDGSELSERAEIDRQILDRNLQASYELTALRSEPYNLIALTIPARIAWGRRKRPETISDEEYRKTRLFRINKGLKGLFSSAGIKAQEPSPLELATKIKVRLNPNGAERYYQQYHHDAVEFADDIFAAPTLRDGIEPGLVIAAGTNGLRVMNSSHVTRWVDGFEHEAHTAGEGAILHPSTAAQVAMVSSCTTFSLASRRFVANKQQQQVFTRESLHSNPNRLQSSSERKRAREQDSDLDQLTESSSRFVVDWTRYITASVPFVDDEALNDADRDLEETLRRYVTTRNVLLSEERWPELLTALLGIHQK